MRKPTRKRAAALAAIAAVTVGVLAIGSAQVFGRTMGSPPSRLRIEAVESPSVGPAVTKAAPAPTNTTATASASASAAQATSTNSVPAPPRIPGPGSLELRPVDRPEDGSGPHDVWIYRPDVPNTAELPVVYFLHGGPGSGRDVFSIGIAAQLDAYVAHGGTPFVLVSPDGNGVAHADPDWADSVDGRDRVETWLTTDVIAAVEGDTPRDRAHRAIAGFSMGGYGAMNIALRHRDLYSQVVAIAGFFHAEDYEGVFGGGPALETANSPDENLDATPMPRILLMDGQQDTEPAVAGETQRFAALLTTHHIPNDTIIAPGHHDWDYGATQLPAAIAYLGDRFAATATHPEHTPPR